MYNLWPTRVIPLIILGQELRPASLIDVIDPSIPRFDVFPLDPKIIYVDIEKTNLCIDVPGEKLVIDIEKNDLCIDVPGEKTVINIDKNKTTIEL